MSLLPPPGEQPRRPGQPKRRSPRREGCASIGRPGGGEARPPPTETVCVAYSASLSEKLTLNEYWMR